MQAIDDQILAYEYLILRIIHKYRLHKELDYYMQIGRLAIWKATKSYNENKGDFEMYAYMFIKFSVFREIKQAIEVSDHEVVTENDLLATHIDTNVSSIEESERPTWFYALNVKEQTIIELLYYKRYSMVEVAKIKNIPYESLKKRKRRLLTKIKEMIEQEKDERL